MSVVLPDLPFAADALEPFMSRETLAFHHGKHHQTYVNNLNKLIAGTPLENASLEEIVRQSEGAIFNNAAQVWNHNFFWLCLSAQEDVIPEDLRAALTQTFGSVESFVEAFSAKAIGQFGSGWAWLVWNRNNDTLEITSTSNAQTPLKETHLAPLLTCDVWEHAYYIDYRNARPNYISAFMKHIHWSFVAEQWRKAQA